MTYYNVKLSNNQNNNCIVGHGDPNVWYKKFDESTKREYYEITDYKIKLPGEQENLTVEEQKAPEQVAKETLEKVKTKQIMSTGKKSKCDGDCCGPNNEELVSQLKSKKNMMLTEVFRQQKCNCIKVKAECGDDCGCDPETCTNR